MEEATIFEVTQFVEPARGSAGLQIVALGALFMLAALVVFGAIALAAGRLGAWLRRSPAVQRVMNVVAGLVFVGLAARLATVER